MDNDNECADHDRTTDECEEIFAGRLCPGCDEHRVTGFDSNGHTSRLAMYCHVGCAEADETEADDLTPAYFWDASDWYRCKPARGR